MNNKQATSAAKIAMKLRRQLEESKAYWDQIEPVWRAGMLDTAERLSMDKFRKTFNELRRGVVPRSGLNGIAKRLEDVEKPQPNTPRVSPHLPRQKDLFK